ncbi:MAG: hypothetical protein O7F73_19090 [Gammaproteobacteria bacterium]|nr:hypothetical protein [Gammaproteobacteria bacterium]
MKRKQRGAARGLGNTQIIAHCLESLLEVAQVPNNTYEVMSLEAQIPTTALQLDG